MDDIQVEKIPCRFIVSGDNDRKSFNEQELRELASSIESDGLIQPITIRPVATPDFPEPRYQIVAGERRFRAMIMLGWNLIPCIVRRLKEEDASNFMLSENTSRSSLLPMEESDAYQKRIDKFNMSPDKIANKAGVSKARVLQFLQLQKLSPYVKGLVNCGVIPINYAKSLTKLDDNRQYFAVLVFKNRPNMPMRVWAEVCNKFHEEQVEEQGLQRNFLDMVSEQTKFVDAVNDNKSTGRDAITGLTCNISHLPPRIADSRTVADILADCIRYYRKHDNTDTVSVLSSLLNILVERRLITLPVDFKPFNDTRRTVGNEMDRVRKIQELIESIHAMKRTPEE